MNDASVPDPHMSDDDIRARLALFLTNNPASSLGDHPTGKDRGLSVLDPWGDSSLAMPLRTGTERLIDALNNVLLPNRFTAIYHTDQSKLEVIFTAYPLTSHNEVLLNRKFEFCHLGVSHKCAFERCSSRLLTIAEFATPITESDTEYRNLQSFYIYTVSKQASSSSKAIAKRYPDVGTPLSFWIDNVDWDEGAVLSLVRHLNFYMTYYDRKSPTILVHTPAVESATVQPDLSRYRNGKFPVHIKSRNTEENLLHFWNAARGGDPAQRFLFNFRIVEYVSFSFLEDELWVTVQRALGSPHAMDDLAKTTDEVVSAMQATKLDPTQKFDAVVRKFVSIKSLWDHLCHGTSPFCSETQFDGGLTIPAVINPNMKQKDLAMFAVDKISKNLRDIRNALSHGKDLKTAQVIAPTPANFTKLQPWASLMSTIASEVMINRSIST